MSSNAADPWAAVETARAAWKQVDAEIPRLRMVHSDLSDLHDALERNKPGRAQPGAVVESLDRLGGESADRRQALGFLTDPLFEDGTTLHDAFKRGRAITPAADAVAGALTAYVGGSDWSAVRTAVSDVVQPSEGPMAVDTTTLDQLVTLFELAIEAGIAARSKHADALSKALVDAYGGTSGTEDLLADLDEQPIAMLPVRLETRFVDKNRKREGELTDLLVRVYPDQIHVDSHEEQLTDDEVLWGQNFWATLWYARHPDPSVVPNDPTAEYLTGRLPTQRLRELVADIDPGKFSDQHHKRYRELKERAWKQLLDRFGRKRAAYVVHALEPTDSDLADDLLTRPDPPPDLDLTIEQPPVSMTPVDVAKGGGGDTKGSKSQSDQTSAITDPKLAFDDPALSGTVTETPTVKTDLSGLSLGDSGQSGGNPGSGGSEASDKSRTSLPNKVPAISFPEVPRKPQSWTQQPRAALLPDRWVAIGEWEDGQGKTQRTAVAGNPVREPLPMGPSPESVAAENVESGDSDSPAPEGTGWMVDFDEATSVGMGLRLNIAGLSGFDPARGFSRLMVVGVKASMDASATPDAVEDLLDGHHYTDGLEFLEGGTPTNNHDGSAGYSRTDDPLESMDVECVPPLVESGDRSDGDLLARALAVDSADDHVFANVENADGTQQRDARHMNSALWPATFGYFFQDLMLDNKFTSNASLWGGPSKHLTGSQRRSALDTPMLWHDAYRRHFVRYVRGQGPFPAMRVGKQPYGILPTKAIETDIDVTIVDQTLVADLQQGKIQLAEVKKQGTSTSDLVDAGVSPQTMLDAGGNPDELLSAGADPMKVVAGAVDPKQHVDPRDLAPEALTKDGLGLLATSGLTKSSLEEAGIPVEDLEQAGVTVRDLARGEVTQEQLSEAGVTTEAIAAVVLPERVKSLGITPRALEQAGVTPAALLRGEISMDQIRKLGLSTRAVADAVLPREVRQLGITPKKLADVGVSPQELINGNVSASDLQQAGVSTEALAEALLPQELKDFGITPKQLGEAVSVDDLFNGNVGIDDLRQAGLTTENLADAVLPQSFREAGITPDSLSSAGITVDAVLNGTVTPEDVVQAGVTPEALADAGVLPDALSEVGHVASDLIDAGLKPAELLEQGLSPQSLLDAGIDPGLLVDAGLAPKKLVDAGVSAVHLATKAGAPMKTLASSGASASELARVGATVADLAGSDVPASELVKAGFTAVDVLQSGADALGVAQGGARPTELKDAGVDAGTLREAGKAAGSLQLAGYSAQELLDTGYTAEELLNGGFSPEELEQAGVDPATVEAAGRAVGDLLAAGHPPAELKASGYSAKQLLDAGLDAAQLAAAGYTAGELTDAGVPAKDLAAAGVEPGELRAAGAEIADLAEGDVDPKSLKEAGASAEQLLGQGFDPQELLDAGFESVELEVAGVDVDQLAQDVVEGQAGADEVADAAIEGLQYAATVFEDPNQAEKDLYSFSFDPALPKLAGGETPQAGTSGGSDTEAGQPDGGVAAGVPVVRPLAIDDQLPADLEARISSVGSRWSSAAEGLPFAGSTDEGGLLDALKREGLSADLRQQTMAYSAESISYGDPLNRLVRMEFGSNPSAPAVLKDLSRKDTLDPRLGHFYLTDMGVQQLKDMASGPMGLSPFQQFHANYPTQGIIEPREIVDGNVDAFIDVLLESTLLDVEQLSHRIDPDELSLDTSLLEDTDWKSLDTGEKRGRIVNAIEDAEDPAGFAKRLLGGTTDTAAGYEKIQQLGENQSEHGDSGALRSVLRLLLQHGMLHEYVAARRRLGMAFDELPGGWPDPAYYGGTTEGPLAPLYDDAPAALSSHPNVGSMDSVSASSGGSGDYRYADALQDAAANYTSTTSIDPRLSEFTDSLAYLRDVDPAALSRLARETLDLANHRLDAWWTSLATKRLFELREAQGTYDSDAGFDHTKWSGGGSDVPRATVDPGMLSSMPVDPVVAPSSDTGSGQPESGTGQADSGGSGSMPTGETTAKVAQFDPATIANVELSTGSPGKSGDSDSQTDGGTGQSGHQSQSSDQQGTSTSGGASESGSATEAGGDSVPPENVAKRKRISDSAKVHDRATSKPGLYVGGYGFVENLAADTGSKDGPEYIHAPSEQHATTAAILRGGAQAHDADEGMNALSVDLPAERVRSGLRLIRGVRRGQSPGELLGYRFERRLQEETVTRGSEINLMEHLDDFRAAFPTTHGKLKRPDEQKSEAKAERREGLAARDTLDGYQLLKHWDEYPFGRSDLPGTNSTEYDILDDIVGDLQTNIDAAGDLLTAESVHQLGQGNFQRAGGSVSALARGEPLPDPKVAQTPRSETGVTHRQCLLFGTHAPDSSATPRTVAEPALAEWVETLLPAAQDVECRATYRWTETTTDPATGRETETEHTAETSATLSDLDLGPLDVLLLFGADREETRSELEQRLVYRLLRTRPDDPPVPADASLDLKLTGTATDGATSMADLLELARSIREVVQSSRPVNAEDLAHPTDKQGEGYDETTAKTLTARANSAQDRLLEIARAIDDRVALLDSDHEAGDGLKGVPTPPKASADGGTVEQSSSSTGGATVPEDTAPAPDPLAVENPTVTEQVTGLAESVRAADEALPLSAVESVAGSIDGNAVRPELSTLVDTLPAGPADPNTVTEDITVQSEAGQRIGGTLGEPVTVPDVSTGDGGDTGDSGDTGDTGSDGSDTGDTGSDGSDTGDSGDGGSDASTGDQFRLKKPQLQVSALGTTDKSEGTVTIDSRPEIELSDRQWYAREANLQIQDVGQPQGDQQADDQQGGDQQGGDQGSTQEPTDQGPDWSSKTATVRVWGTDGLSLFEMEQTTTPNADGSFGIDLDFSSVSAGTPFHVVAVVDGTVAYSATGRVVADGGISTSTQQTLDTDCRTLKQLLWLAKHQDRFSVDSGPSADLDLALDRMEWNAIQTERDAVDTAASTVTQDDVTAVDALLDVKGLDPATLAESVATSTAPVNTLGLDTVIDVTGGEGQPADYNYWFGVTQGVGDVRARVTRTLANPALFNDGAPARLLAYHHDAGATLHAMNDGETVAAYLDAFLAQPAWTVRYIDRKVSEPAALVRDLTAWLYSPGDLSSTGALATALRNLAGSVSDLPALEALFEGLPAGTSTTRLSAFEGYLQSLASALESGSPSLGDASTARSAFDSNRTQAAGDLNSDATAERTALSPVQAGVERSFRKMVLERLREPMTVAASYGVYGGTPESADGGRPEDEGSLVEQAQALLQRLRSRLTEAAALDPRIETTLADRPVPQRVEDGTDRLETLFGDGFTVLPPFSPSNPEELTATFTDDGLVPDERGMAAETWLQRAASFRERVSDFREARSYAEALTGRFTPSLSVGQVPFEPGDTWIGVDGVEPTPGRLSLVSQFGPGASPASAGGQLTGLFVDEWTEGVPEDSETTGVALNYDDPGNRAPQSVLLATPGGESWSLDELASVVAETAEYAKRRAVDVGEMSEVSRLFPALYFAQQTAPEPATPTVDFRMLDWYDREPVLQLQPPVAQLDMTLPSGESDSSDTGDGNSNGGSS